MRGLAYRGLSASRFCSRSTTMNLRHPMRWRGWTGIIAAIAVLVLLGAEPGADVRPAAVGPVVHPIHIRVELEGDAARELSIALTVDRAARLMAVETDCRCLHGLDPLPLDLPAGVAVPVRLRATGALPGLKTVRLRTTVGTAVVQVQIVSHGLGQGRDAVLATLTAARQQGIARVVFLLHDLRGERRNCGCSAGSLGGLEHLAALPAWLAREAGDMPVQTWLSGQVDAATDGNAQGDGPVATALIAAGWQRAPASAVVITADPAAALTQPDALVVIPTVAIRTQHQRLLRPLLDRGMVVEALGITADNRIRFRHTIPVDRTWPTAPEVLAQLPPEPRVAIHAHHDPSASCLPCHQQAHAVWQASAHAQACDRLAAGDRTAACVQCHTTPNAVADAPLIAHVHCQGCHTGADAHAAAHGTVRTTGTVDCRSCHDAKHHPSFDPVAAWDRIRHGR